MGQLEKIVVLAVLSLVALILVFTFDRQEPGGESLAGALAGRDPASQGAGQLAPIAGRSTRDAKASAPAPRDLDLARPFEGVARPASEEEFAWPEAARGEGSGGTSERAPGNGLLLSSKVGASEPEPTFVRDPGLPEEAALLSLRDLEDTWDPELKQYVWRSSDTFAGLARRFYGERGSVELLRLANEGRESVQPGETILVPVFDRRGEAPARPSAGRVHVVLEGESLWSIAKQEYGRGNDWQKLLDANRDRLSGPEDLRAGLELIVP